MKNTPSVFFTFLRESNLKVTIRAAFRRPVSLKVSDTPGGRGLFMKDKPCFHLHWSTFCADKTLTRYSFTLEELPLLPVKSSCAP
ncbi:unnamed protein product [Rodentolepis nana]|uniref:Uncharacterized protein n=1 Tax=Rodentolepis nana TaxID=102285 RepID=A0A0R3TC55_RODNA|nr:unnamed protein product [Rodentolepis nana]